MDRYGGHEQVGLHCHNLTLVSLSFSLRLLPCQSHVLGHAGEESKLNCEVSSSRRARLPGQFLNAQLSFILLLNTAKHMLDLAHAFSRDKSSRHLVLPESTSLFYGPQEACRCKTAKAGTDALVGVAHGTHR